MSRWEGGCHCGAVRIAIESDLARAIRCNCSLCLKKGMLYHRVAPENFTLLAGREAVRLYQFGTMVARHWFCGASGIHVHANPRSAPHLVSVNVNCLDLPDAVRDAIEIVPFDGRDAWEASSAAANR